MRKNKFLLLFALSLFTVLQAQTLPPSYLEDNKDKAAIFRAEAERINDLVHTKIALKFDYDKEVAFGEEWVTLKPHFYPTKEVVLDAKAMLIHEVALFDGKTTKALKHDYDNLKLKIALDKTYTREQQYTIYIKYTAQPNKVEQKGSAAISDAKGLYFINSRGEEADKPTQIWTQGETEASSCWFPTIDQTNQKTSQEIYLTVPDKYLTLSNGLMKNQTKNADGTRTDYWKFDEKHAPYLFFFGVGDYALVKDKWKNIDVDYYVEKEYAPYAKEIFGNTPEMIQYFSDLLDYPYPWVKYAQMTAKDYVSGAMENTTVSLFYDRVQQKPGQLIDENTAETIIAHELFHHWFGNLVTAESWGNLTINESFANYSESLWLEHKYGKEKAAEHLFSERDGYIKGGKFDINLVRTHYDSREDMFDGISYNKGGIILHMLRNYLGDDAFFKGLNKYLKDNAYGKAEAVQLRLALEEVSGRDLNWFFNQWYYSNGHPKLNIGYAYDESSKKVKLTVLQTQKPLFEFPLVVDILKDGKTQRQTVWIPQKAENILEIDFKGMPDVVIPNADQVLLAEITENKSIEQFIAQYNAPKSEYATRRYALEALAAAQSTNDKALNTLVQSMNDSFPGLRIFAMHSLDMNNPKVKAKALAVLKQLAAEDPKTLVQAAALNSLVMADEIDTGIFEKALKSKSFSVQAAAVSGLIKTNPTKAKEYVTELDPEVIKGSSQLVAEVLESWIQTNDLSKADLAAEAVAFYYFVSFQEPSSGTKLEKGFEWIMSNNTPSATKKIMQIYGQYYTYLKKENPGAADVIKGMAENALNIKTQAFKINNTKELEQQVALIQKTITNFK